MKTVAYIPIKLNSERVPNKNIKAFDNGKPLINYILDTAGKIEEIDELYVYCSSEKIKDYIPPQTKFLKRPEYLDLSSTSISEVIKSFTETIVADIYVVMHSTAPFIKPESVADGIHAILNRGHDSAFPVTVNQDFLWVDGKPNYDTISIPRTQDLTPFYIETTGFYIYKRNLIVENNSRIGINPYFIPVSKIEATDINEAIDFEIANAIYNYIIKQPVKSDITPPALTISSWIVFILHTFSDLFQSRGTRCAS